MESETDFESDITDGDLEKNPKINLQIDKLKRHICPYEGCHSAFNRPWKLERHVNTHTNNRPFKCDFPQCTKDYTNKSHLQRHKSLSHAEIKTSPVYICCPFPGCMKTFSNKWNLKRHCNVHKNLNSHKCDICSLTFKKHGQLKKHVSIHMGLKPFACKTCNESFQEKKDLKRHEKKHKTYFCNQENCEKEFITFHALRTHKKIAHPKWLKCDFCGSQYLNKWTLTEHIFTHLPKESREVSVCPYKDCGRYYLHQRNLGHHIKSYHQNINYECDICKQTLVTKSKLRKHQKLHLEQNKPKASLTKSKTSRKPRKDKGKPQKSKAAMLSGIELPNIVNKNLAQNNMTPEVIECIQNIRETLFQQDENCIL